MNKEVLKHFDRPEAKKIFKLLRKTKYRITDERVMSYDSPTGKAYIGISKRPLQKVTNGYGFKGVLIQTDNREFIQCHVCGKWRRIITTIHLKSHNLTQEEYKKKFGLLKTTALVSDSMSYSLEERGRKNIERFNLTEQAESSRFKPRNKLQQMARKEIVNNDEHNNRYALCEKQLGFRLIEYIKQYRILPSRGQKKDGGMIAKALYRRYGSLNEGFKHYEVAQLHRQGSNVELIAPNNQQMFFNYNKDYNRDRVWAWMLENTPRLSIPNVFKD